MPKLDQETLRVIAELVQQEKCILFLGAGANAPTAMSPFKEAYPEAVQPMLGRDLTVRLASRLMASDKPLARTFQEECQQKYDRLVSVAGAPMPALRDEFAKLAESRIGEEEESGLRNMLFASLPNLARVALFYEKTFDRNRLMEDIAGAVQGGTTSEKKPSPALRRVGRAAVPDRDHHQLRHPLRDGADVGREAQPLQERLQAQRQLRRPPADRRPGRRTLRPAPRSSSRSTATSSRRRTPSSSPTRTTSSSCSGCATRGRFRSSPRSCSAPSTTTPILFIGYRMMDYNLRLLLKTIRWTRRTRPSANRCTPWSAPPIRCWRRSSRTTRKGIDFIVEDVWTFVPALYKAIMRREGDGARAGAVDEPAVAAPPEPFRGIATLPLPGPADLFRAVRRWPPPPAGGHHLPGRALLRRIGPGQVLPRQRPPGARCARRRAPPRAGAGAPRGGEGDRRRGVRLRRPRRRCRRRAVAAPSSSRRGRTRSCSRWRSSRVGCTP